jgi:hypothetical protein
MNIDISRQDLHHTRLREDVRTLIDGEVRLDVESFGLTSNNITYGVFGDMMNYWDFFPTPGDDRSLWGGLPVWGFGVVCETTVAELSVGEKVFGYFPLASSFVLSPGRFDKSGFSDLALHRQHLPSVYNRYAYIAEDSAYAQEHEAMIMLLRPLFLTSFVVDDFLIDHDLYGADTVVISSASSKTAIGAAFLLAERKNITVVGVTSSSNAAFVSSLDCYDQTVTYDHVEELSGTHAIYIDVAGRRDITRQVHRHYGNNLAYSMVVGDTHWDAVDEDLQPLEGPKPEFLFAPVQITKRRSDWGREGFEEHAGAAWNRFLPWAQTWMRVLSVSGAAAITATYLDLLNGEIDPSLGHVCTFSSEPNRNENAEREQR